MDAEQGALLHGSDELAPFVKLVGHYKTIYSTNSGRPRLWLKRAHGLTRRPESIRSRQRRVVRQAGSLEQANGTAGVLQVQLQSFTAVSTLLASATPPAAATQPANSAAAAGAAPTTGHDSAKKLQGSSIAPAAAAAVQSHSSDVLSVVAVLADGLPAPADTADDANDPVLEYHPQAAALLHVQQRTSDLQTSAAGAAAGSHGSERGTKRQRIAAASASSNDHQQQASAGVGQERGSSSSSIALQLPPWGLHGMHNPHLLLLVSDAFSDVSALGVHSTGQPPGDAAAAALDALGQHPSVVAGRSSSAAAAAAAPNEAATCAGSKRRRSNDSLASSEAAPTHGVSASGGCSSNQLLPTARHVMHRLDAQAGSKLFGIWPMPEAQQQQQQEIELLWPDGVLPVLWAAVPLLDAGDSNSSGPTAAAAAAAAATDSSTQLHWSPEVRGLCDATGGLVCLKPGAAQACAVAAEVFVPHLEHDAASPRPVNSQASDVPGSPQQQQQGSVELQTQTHLHIDPCPGSLLSVAFDKPLFRWQEVHLRMKLTVSQPASAGAVAEGAGCGIAAAAARAGAWNTPEEAARPPPAAGQAPPQQLQQQCEGTALPHDIHLNFLFGPGAPDWGPLNPSVPRTTPLKSTSASRSNCSNKRSRGGSKVARRLPITALHGRCPLCWTACGSSAAFAAHVQLCHDRLGCRCVAPDTVELWVIGGERQVPYAPDDDNMDRPCVEDYTYSNSLFGQQLKTLGITSPATEINPSWHSTATKALQQISRSSSKFEQGAGHSQGSGLGSNMALRYDEVRGRYNISALSDKSGRPGRSDAMQAEVQDDLQAGGGSEVSGSRVKKVKHYDTLPAQAPSPAMAADKMQQQQQQQRRRRPPLPKQGAGSSAHKQRVPEVNTRGLGVYYHSQGANAVGEEELGAASDDEVDEAYCRVLGLRDFHAKADTTLAERQFMLAWNKFMNWPKLPRANAYTLTPQLVRDWAVYAAPRCALNHALERCYTAHLMQLADFRIVAGPDVVYCMKQLKEARDAGVAGQGFFTAHQLGLVEAYAEGLAEEERQGSAAVGGSQTVAEVQQQQQQSKQHKKDKWKVKHKKAAEPAGQLAGGAAAAAGVTGNTQQGALQQGGGQQQQQQQEQGPVRPVELEQQQPAAEVQAALVQAAGSVAAAAGGSLSCLTVVAPALAAVANAGAGAAAPAVAAAGSAARDNGSPVVAVTNSQPSSNASLTALGPPTAEKHASSAAAAVAADGAAMACSTDLHDAGRGDTGAVGAPPAGDCLHSPQLKDAEACTAAAAAAVTAQGGTAATGSLGSRSLRALDGLGSSSAADIVSNGNTLAIHDLRLVRPQVAVDLTANHAAAASPGGLSLTAAHAGHGFSPAAPLHCGDCTAAGADVGGGVEGDILHSPSNPSPRMTLGFGEVSPGLAADLNDLVADLTGRESRSLSPAPVLLRTPATASHSAADVSAGAAATPDAGQQKAAVGSKAGCAVPLTAAAVANTTPAATAYTVSTTAAAYTKPATIAAAGSTGSGAAVGVVAAAAAAAQQPLARAASQDVKTPEAALKQPLERTPAESGIKGQAVTQAAAAAVAADAANNTKITRGQSLAGSKKAQRLLQLLGGPDDSRGGNSSSRGGSEHNTPTISGDTAAAHAAAAEHKCPQQPKQPQGLFGDDVAVAAAAAAAQGTSTRAAGARTQRAQRMLQLMGGAPNTTSKGSGKAGSSNSRGGTATNTPAVSDDITACTGAGAKRLIPAVTSALKKEDLPTSPPQQQVQQQQQEEDDAEDKEEMHAVSVSEPQQDALQVQQQPEQPAQMPQPQVGKASSSAVSPCAATPLKHDLQHQQEKVSDPQQEPVSVLPAAPRATTASKQALQQQQQMPQAQQEPVRAFPAAAASTGSAKEEFAARAADARNRRALRLRQLLGETPDSSKQGANSSSSKGGSGTHTPAVSSGAAAAAVDGTNTPTVSSGGAAAGDDAGGARGTTSAVSNVLNQEASCLQQQQHSESQRAAAAVQAVSKAQTAVRALGAKERRLLQLMGITPDTSLGGTSSRMGSGNNTPTVSGDATTAARQAVPAVTSYVQQRLQQAQQQPVITPGVAAAAAGVNTQGATAAVKAAHTAAAAVGPVAAELAASAAVVAGATLEAAAAAAATAAGSTVTRDGAVPATGAVPAAVARVAEPDHMKHEVLWQGRLWKVKHIISEVAAYEVLPGTGRGSSGNFAGSAPLVCLPTDLLADYRQRTSQAVQLYIAACSSSRRMFWLRPAAAAQAAGGDTGSSGGCNSSSNEQLAEFVDELQAKKRCGLVKVKGGTAIPAHGRHPTHPAVTNDAGGAFDWYLYLLLPSEELCKQLGVELSAAASHNLQLLGLLVPPQGVQCQHQTAGQQPPQQQHEQQLASLHSTQQQAQQGSLQQLPSGARKSASVAGGENGVSAVTAPADATSRGESVWSLAQQRLLGGLSVARPRSS